MPKTDRYIGLQRFDFTIMGRTIHVLANIFEGKGGLTATLDSICDEDLYDVEIEGYSLYVEGRGKVNIDQLLQEEALKRYGDEHEEG